MNAARGYQKLDEPEATIDALDRMINSYPQHLLVPDAYLKLAQTHASLVAGPDYDQASSRDAAAYYEDFMILFPNDPNVAVAAKGAADMKTMLAESKIKMGDFYFYKRDNYTAAKVLYNEAITVYPDSEVASRARKKLTAVEGESGRQTRRGRSERAEEKELLAVLAHGGVPAADLRHELQSRAHRWISARPAPGRLCALSARHCRIARVPHAVS